MYEIDFLGRPFAVELLNPHRVKFNKNEIKQLQEVKTGFTVQWHSFMSLFKIIRFSCFADDQPVIWQNPSKRPADRHQVSVFDFNTHPS